MAMEVTPVSVVAVRAAVGIGTGSVVCSTDLGGSGAAMSEGEASIPVGTVVGGRWRMTGFLGAGGFGQVLLAEDVSELRLGQAAVKVLHPNTSPQERQSFLGEVKKIAVLRHQNLVGYLDSGLLQLDEHGEIRPYLVTELCERSLGDHVAASPSGVLSAEETQHVLQDVVAGLAHLHDRGLIHRDIKPGNVLAADGHWKLADFGLMRDLTASGAYHRGDHLIGTPLYMAPELFSTSMATAPSDVYAVGVVAHLCLAGRPLHGGTGPALVHNIATQPPSIEPSIDANLAELIRWCTAADPARRPTAAELVDRVPTIRPAGRTVAVSPPLPPSPTPAPIPTPGLVRSGDTIGAPTAPRHTDLAPPPAAFRGAGPAPTGSPPRRWLVPVGAAVVIALALAGMAVAAVSLRGQGDEQQEARGGEPGEQTDPSGEPPADPLDSAPASGADGGGDAADAGVEVGEGVEIGRSSPGSAASSATVADPLSHLDGAPCSSGSVDQVVVTNRHDVAVDYRLSVNHQDADGVRIDESFDTATAVPPGASALLAMAPTEPGAVGCQVAELVAEPSDPFLLDDFDSVAIEQCVRTSDTGADVTFTVSNPLDVVASIEVSIVVTDAAGLIIDEWFSESVDQVAPGERVRSDVSWTYFNLGAVDPGAPLSCTVSWLDIRPA